MAKKRGRPRKQPSSEGVRLGDIDLPPLPEIQRPLVPPPVVRPARDDGPQMELVRQATSLLAELAARQTEALALYEPLPIQAAFHASKAQTRLVRGSNRAGKTLSAAVEIARAATGQDPHRKYPSADGRAFLIGKDGKHLGDVMYRKLFRPRPFAMIRDTATNKWRAWRPWEPGDAARKHETKPAPALIPRRFVKEIAWENKKQSVPTLIRLQNGWELNFFSSLAKPPQGSDVDLVWMDEEIVDPDWLPEMQARILDRAGRIVWSATPQAGTEHLYDLHERAEVEAAEPNPSVTEHVVLLADNRFMDEQAKIDFEKNISGEDERLVRVGGEFAVSSFKVYPEYGDRHAQAYFDVPRHWTRYLFVDPGRQRCAVLFGAVPPPGEDARRYVYDELYIKDCDAMKFGKAVSDKVKDFPLQACFIDAHEARKREAGSGRSIGDQYAAALKRYGVVAVDTGSDFAPAPDDLDGGIEAARGWLVEDADGLTRLRVFKEKCQNFDREMRRYHYKRVGTVVTDKPVKKNDHLADCLRYFALADPPYRKPKKPSKTHNGITKYLAKKRARRAKGSGRPRVNLGPGQ